MSCSGSLLEQRNLDTVHPRYNSQVGQAFSKILAGTKFGCYTVMLLKFPFSTSIHNAKTDQVIHI